MKKIDMRDVLGQEHVKRGLEVAVVGGHNVLFIGSDLDECVKIAERAKTISDKEHWIATYSMKPCPCGNFTHPKKICTCTPTMIHKHIAQFPTFILDKIDIHLEVPYVNKKMLTEKRRGEPSSDIKKRVMKCIYALEARMIELSTIPEIPIDKEAEELLKLAILELGISAKAYDKILRVALTIAVMDGKDIVEAHHISEAISYRSLDRNLWG